MGNGARPTVVLLHEGLGSAELWRDFPERVADALGGARTFAYTRRGYGHAPPVPLPRPITYMHEEADVLRDLLARERIERPVLIGHSDGASIAILAAGSGLPVHSLVLIAPHVFVEDVGLEAIRAAKVAYETGTLRDKLARHHDDVDVAFRGWNDVWLSAEFRTWDITSSLTSIICPVLLVQSEADPYGTIAQLDAIGAGVSGSVERLVVPGASHAPHVEHRDAVIAAIARVVS